MLSLQIQPTTTNRPRRARSGDAYARRNAAVVNEAHSYHPSLVNRIVAISSIDGTVNYTYGIGGNSAPELLRTADYSNAAIPDEVYNHDQNYNRILDSEHGSGFVYGPGNRLVSDGIYNYQYDHEGNMTRRTEIATGDYRVFDYDERNRLVALADYDFAGATLMTEQMSYDAFDRRISLQVDTAPGDGVEAAVTHFGYDGEDVIVDAVDPDGASGPAAAAVETTYLHGAGIDEVLAQEKAGMGTQWLLTDHLGSTRDIVDNSGSVLNHIIFNSFGGIVSQSNAAFSSRYLYTQREFDAASGLNYYRTRYYDSSVGRFLSEDPISKTSFSFVVAGQSNLYAYVANNPVSLVDPSGLAPRALDSVNAAIIQAIARGDAQQAAFLVNEAAAVGILSPAAASAYQKTIATIPTNNLTGQFSIIDNSFKAANNAIRTYPTGNVPFPQGPFHFNTPCTQRAVRAIADKVNRNLNTGLADGLGGPETHEIQPLSWGGSAADLSNKVGIASRALHQQYSSYWLSFQSWFRREGIKIQKR